MLIRKIKWGEPLEFAAGISPEEDFALLYSGMQTSFSGRKTILAMITEDEVTSGGFESLAAKLSDKSEKYDNCWFGYFGYGLKNELEKLPDDEKSYINMPDIWFVNFGLILEFCHDSETITAYAKNSDYFAKIPQKTKLGDINPVVGKISSNMNKRQYLDKVLDIKEAILRGDLYQANLTRKFTGNVKDATAFDIFSRLCNISPSPYAAFLKLGKYSVISSSPERFLYIDDKGNVDTRPIKGSAARSKTDDMAAKKALLASEKDRAENLMIVDLCRNDLARACETGSIVVDELFAIETYSTVHHMVSTVRGKKLKNKSTLDVIKAAFPPGSMTGTPKIKAISMCSELEKKARGVYSGALGFLGGDGSTDLSVVIRTIIMQGEKFEFQVGGAIVHDSIPEKEWEETMVKARGVSQALGIKDFSA